jgi:ethanolamine-phosphate phospho-lyase
MAKTITERSFIAVLEHGYHGNTMLGIDASSYKFDGKGGKGKPENVIKLPLPKEYRGAHSTGKAYALEAISILEKHIALGEKPAAFLAEPISGCGGQVPLTKDYLAELKPFLEKHGILLIIDEVQTGFGRLGSHFWGFELHRIIPDLVILGKPMGNGHPIGGVITRADLSAQFDTGMEFFSSFGGNPISCAIGEKVLDIIKADSLQENALEVGNYWRDELLALQRRFPVMADVRGYGVFIGVEFLNDDHTPATELAQNIKNKMKEHFILTSTDGPFDNVLKMKASLCFSKENVDEFMGTLICALGEIYM